MSAPTRSSPDDVVRAAYDAGVVTAASEAETARQFWLRHAYLGVGLSAATIIGLTLYAQWGAAADSARDVLLSTAAIGAALTTVVAVVCRRVVESRWRLPFFVAWSVAVMTLLLVATAADGGDQSPLTATLFLPLVFAGVAYPPAAVLSLGLLELAGYVVMALVDATPSGWTAGLAAMVLGLTALMATRAARNRETQRLRLRRLAAALEDQATHDPLTGCLNRRAFDDALEVEVARARRYERPLSVLLVDVDLLKHINDARGHAAGDEALLRVCAALRTVSRRSDLIARLGGDEFVVLATETPLDDAVELASRLHAALRSDPPSLRVTVSIGIAALGAHVADAAGLVRAADMALYDAKAAGRDRTAVAAKAPPTMPTQRRITT